MASLSSKHMFAFETVLGYKKEETFLSSSMAEHAAVNRRVVGSSPTWGVFLFLLKIQEEISKTSLVRSVSSQGSFSQV
jgi:hypothetical protein